MAQQYVASGLTCASDGGIHQAVLIRGIQELARTGELPIRMRMDLWYELMPHLAALGIGEGFGNNMVKINGIKIVADGPYRLGQRPWPNHISTGATISENWPSLGKSCAG